jgi:hypothetical protein
MYELCVCLGYNAIPGLLWRSDGSYVDCSSRVGIVYQELGTPVAVPASDLAHDFRPRLSYLYRPDIRLGLHERYTLGGELGIDANFVRILYSYVLSCCKEAISRNEVRTPATK